MKQTWVCNLTNRVLPKYKVSISSKGTPLADFDFDFDFEE
jgi:hypothetical protein